MSIDWKKEIAILVYVKQTLADFDKSHLWQYHLPEIAASDEEIKNAEKFLGFQLDDRYVEFLRHANGWKSFYQSVDLFGTRDLVDAEKMRHVQSMIDSIEKNAIESSGLEKDELFAIGATPVDMDIFLMAKPPSINAGKVYWFAGQEIDNFPSFDEFYLAMVDYNRAEIEDMKNELDKS